MIKNTSISWPSTKENVNAIIKKYNFVVLSVSPSVEIVDEALKFKLIQEEDLKKEYIKLTKEEIEERIKFINYVRFSYNKLTTDERKIIYWTFFDKENNYDDRFIANNLGFSLGYYYIKKKDAIIRFAFSVGVESIDDK